MSESLPPNYVRRQYEWNRETGKYNAYNDLVQERATQFVEKIHATIDNEPTSIIDVGCREGYSLITFSEKMPSSRVVGVDIVPEFVSASLQVADEVYECNAHDLSRFKNKEFDWAFTSHMLEHCYAPDKAFAEIGRITRNGIFVIVPLEDEESFLANEDHFFYSTDPTVWLTKLQTPGWVLMEAKNLPSGELYAIFSRTSE